MKTVTSIENARIQEDPARLDLPHIEYYSAQLPAVDSVVADLLLRVRGLAVGHRSTRSALYRVWRQVPREVQGSAQCRLPTK